MKSSFVTLCLLVFTFFLLFLIAGCQGLSNMPIATPGTSPGSGGATPQHNTFVFAANASTGKVSEFHTNPDGTVTPISGSPLSLGATVIRTAGNHLFVVTDANLVSYNVDPSSGTLTQVGSMPLPPPSSSLQGNRRVIAADTKNVYVDGKNPAGDYALFGFTVSTDGSLAQAPGFPLFVGNGCPDLCGIPGLLAMNSHFLWLSITPGGHGPGQRIVFSRQSDGSLQRTDAQGGTVTSMLPHPNGELEYEVDDRLMANRIDASGRVHFLFAMDDQRYNTAILDRAGKFLLATDFRAPENQLEVRIFTINQSTGDITRLGNATVFAGNTGAMTFDPTSRFLLMPGSNNNLLVFNFNPADATFRQIQDVAAIGVGQPYFVVF